MRRRTVRTLATIALAASAAVATPAVAGSPYRDGAPPAVGTIAGAPPSKRGPTGLFSCSFREVRTKLERKNCGTIRYQTSGHNF